MQLRKNNYPGHPETHDGSANGTASSSPGAAVKDTKKSLESLTSQFRVAARNRKTAECVALLRELRQIEPGNENWKKDLLEFEKERLKEIRQSFEAAKKTQDIKALTDIDAELNQAWAFKPSPALLTDVRDALADAHRAEAAERGVVIKEKLASAYSALDFEKTGTCLSEYDALVAGGHFKPDELFAAQHAEALEWYKEEQKKRQDDDFFKNKISELEQALSAGDAPKTAEILNQLARVDRLIPENFRERADRLAANHEIEQKRRRLVRVAMAVVGLAVFIGCAIALIAYIQFNMQEKEALRELDLAYEAGSLPASETLLANIEQNHPRVWRSSAVQAAAQRIDELRQKESARGTAFNDALSRLDAIKADNFQESQEVVDSIIKTALEHAGSGEEKGRVIVLQREWEGRKQAAQTDVNEKMKVAINSLDSLLAPFKSEWNSKNAEAALPEMDAVLAEAGKLAQASDRLSQQLDSRKAMIERVRSGLVKRREQIKAINNATELSDYLEQIEVYARAFPDDLEAAPMRAVLREKQLYLNANAAGNPRNDEPFWQPTRKVVENMNERLNSGWPPIRDEIVKIIKDDSTLVDLWQIRFGTKDTGYKWVFIRDWGAFGAGAQTVECRYYFPKATDDKAIFSNGPLDVGHISYIDLDGKRKRNGERMKHCREFNQLAEDIMFIESANADAALIKLWWDFSGNTNVPPLLRLIMGNYLAGKLAEISEPLFLPNWQSFRDDLRKSKEWDFDWLCLENPGVTRANQKADDVLAKRFVPSERDGFIKHYKATKTLWETALRNGLVFVGFAEWEGETPKVRFIESFAAKKPSEIWVARIDANNSQPQLLIAEEIYEGRHLSYAKFFNGEPVFASASGKTIRDLRSSILKQYGLANLAFIKQWPSCWPANWRGK